MARRMLLEVARRLTLEGHEVHLVDPESVLQALVDHVEVRRPTGRLVLPLG